MFVDAGAAGRAGRGLIGGGQSRGGGEPTGRLPPLRKRDENESISTCLMLPSINF
jgi:hypothetical protein